MDTALKYTIPVQAVTDLGDSHHDGVVIIGESLAALRAGLPGTHPQVLAALEGLAKVNSSLEKPGEVTLVRVEKLPASEKAVVFACTGPLAGDFDEVRDYKLAGDEAGKKALSAGMRAPLLVVVPSTRFQNSQLLAVLGFLHAMHVPWNVRLEAAAGNKSFGKVDKIGWLHLTTPAHRSAALVQGAQLGKSVARHHSGAEEFLKLANALQAAFQVARDIGDGDPIRMAPPKVAEYVEALFKSSSGVKVHVLSDQRLIEKDYPLMAAVNRGANEVPSHQARLITLEYYNSETPGHDSPPFETLMMVGKGVTIDTGGLDVKIRGAMFGMSLDKYGAAVVAAFFTALDRLKPKGVKVMGHMSMVRNSVSANAYTCDEIITARSGKRIHIVNTDAEGRIAMLDPLTHMRELAANERNPHLFTIATLTGHCVLSYGHCAAVMDNGVARSQQYAQSLQHTGEEYGQPVEVSRLFKEDLDFHLAQCASADLRQAVNKPSVETVRGHMGPAGFLIQGSRIDEHGTESAQPLPYTHIDMAGVLLDHPRHTFPNPLLTLVAHHILPRVG